MEMWEFWDFDCPNQNFKILMSDVKIVRPFGGSQTPKSFWARARNLAKWLGKINWFGFGGNQMRVRDSSRKCLKNQMNFVFFYGFIFYSFQQRKQNMTYGRADDHCYTKQRGARE
jgi:hypothetical protein